MAVRRHGDGVQVRIPDGIRTVSRLVICAGLQTDLLAQAAGDEAGPEIVPFRGEYLRLRPEVKDRVRHLIYPVPDPAYPFLGVHLTPRIDGEVRPRAERGAGAGPRGLPVARRVGGAAVPAGPFGGIPAAGPAELAGGPAGDARLGVPARLPGRSPQLPALARARPRDARRRPGCAPRPWTRTGRWSTTSASTGSARSRPSATRPPRPRRPRWPSPSRSWPSSPVATLAAPELLQRLSLRTEFADQRREPGR